MHIERIACLEEEWLKVLTELGRPDALLACTYAFQHDFFSSLLDRLKEAACGSHRATDGLELANPIDVVCDRHRYEGHKVGFNVHFWDKDTRLFHPKLMIGLFGKRVVWSSGSLNLTRAGWMRNRELAMFHTPARPILPRSLRALLKELPANESATSILKATVDGPDRIGSSIFVSSLNHPIGPHFLRGLPSDAHAVHLVAPFFDRKESGGSSLDLSWMEYLSDRCPKAAFHLYLPLLNEEELLVQGDARVFRSFEKHLRRSGRNLSLHPVPPAPGPLHAKLACVEYVSRGRTRAKMLTGSPNMTSAALLDRQGNVETAWISDASWDATAPLLARLSSQARRVKDLKFTSPDIASTSVWMPLHSAVYDPRKRSLQLEWFQKGDATLTSLHYSDRVLKVEKGHLVTDFNLIGGICWIETRHRTRDIAPGRVPIEIPAEVLPACEDGMSPREPEDWLRLLGSRYASPKTADSHLNPGSGGIPRPDADAASFPSSEKVRDLAARMRYLQRSVVDDSGSNAHRRWMRNLFDSIYENHNPTTAETDDQKVWRVWVRVELWQAA